MRRQFFAGAAAILFACGGGDSSPTDSNPSPQNPPPPVGDASVVIVDATAQHTNPLVLKVTLHLRNEGGPGVYKVQLYGLPTVPNGEDTFFGESEPVEVDETYEETLTYTIETENVAKYAVVYTRNSGSAQYSQTDRFDFPLSQ